ncbi:MSHA biogenesis protein MshP [Vibrio hepatarius]|uniref:MSHA biogenesis protein MshP n=1 Tax=Vibrio hepatarius TaxID=171383 RepID=UPI001C0A0F8C|nr:MSHA biogenesis protein MshP [Vibrio hepatarius]MBU2898763.1 MSHA biogenesis protein MshP [Vibrio hepatarius]
MMRLFTIRHKQTGSGLLLVVFIIVVVVGFVASVANRNQERSSDQFIASVIGTRAELAARSGAQIELSRFYQNPSSGICQSLSVQTIILQGNGFFQCSASVSCASIGSLDDSREIFQLTSTGTCSVGDWQLQRVIQVGLKQ